MAITQNIMRPSYTNDLNWFLTNYLSKSFGGGLQEPSKTVPTGFLDFTEANPNYETELAAYNAAKGQVYQPGQAYGGQLTQAATAQEQTGLGLLSQYLDQGEGELTTAAKAEALKTLQGQYADPNQSPYIKAMQEINQRNLQENVDTLNRQRGALGKYFHSETIAGQNKLEQNALQDLNAQVSSYIEGERNRQTGMVSTAANLDQLSSQAQLAKVQASQQYGGLQRTIEAANLEKQYQDWLRQRTEQQTGLSTAVGLATDNPNYGIETWY